MTNVSPDIWSVSRLTAEIRRLLEDGLPLLYLEGELSNVKHHSSGHRYFTIKDEGAQIPGVMWRTRPDPGFDLRDGLKVRAYGRVVVWEQGGRYQFDVLQLIPAGLGALQMAFEALKTRLAAEGLFDFSRKKPLPRFPQAIGIVTSRTGAALHDLAWGFATRYPPARLYLIPVAVQGEGAAAEIAAAIEHFNGMNLVDMMVIGRGGGSLEDLWAFNEEVVVRAIASSRIPVVSAVGHEIDISLSDLAADLRAPTPTAAAGLMVPDRIDLLATLGQTRQRMSRSLRRGIELWRERTARIRGGYGFRRALNRVNEERMRLTDLAARIEADNRRLLELWRQRLTGTRDRLTALSPSAVMERGFAVARRPDRTIIRSSAVLASGDPLELQFARGSAAVAVIGVKPSE